MMEDFTLRWFLLYSCRRRQKYHNVCHIHKGEVQSIDWFASHAYPYTHHHPLSHPNGILYNNTRFNKVFTKSTRGSILDIFFLTSKSRTNKNQMSSFLASSYTLYVSSDGDSGSILLNKVYSFFSLKNKNKKLAAYFTTVPHFLFFDRTLRFPLLLFYCSSRWRTTP